jgi:hypothetical protein
MVFTEDEISVTKAIEPDIQDSTLKYELPSQHSQLQSSFDSPQDTKFKLFTLPLVPEENEILPTLHLCESIFSQNCDEDYENESASKPQIEAAIEAVYQSRDVTESEMKVQIGFGVRISDGKGSPLLTQ